MMEDALSCALDSVASERVVSEGEVYLYPFVGSTRAATSEDRLIMFKTLNIFLVFSIAARNTIKVSPLRVSSPSP